MSILKRFSKEEIGQELKRFFETAPKTYLPAVSIDTVIFGFHENKLKVLLLSLEDTNHYMLPGGFIKKEEHIDVAALRILQERTGMKNIFLEQFYTSGSINRSSDPFIKEYLHKIAGGFPKDNWFDQRFISVCYYALIDDTKVSPVTEPFFGEPKWFDIKKIPTLLYDHHLIIKKALGRLQSDLDVKLVAFNLMNETFTMGELQQLYEAVYQKKLVRTNFQRKMLSLNILERLEKHYNGKSHKAPYLYKLTENN